MATMPIYGKNLLQNQESLEAESWYIESGDSRSTKFVQMMVVCSNSSMPINKMATMLIYGKNNPYSGSVLEHLLCDLEVAGSIPGRVIPKTKIGYTGTSCYFAWRSALRK